MDRIFAWTDEFMLTLGIGLLGGGAVGSLVMFLLPRRRRGEAPV